MAAGTPRGSPLTICAFNDPVASGALRARAAELGVEPLDDVAGIACADVVLSLVVGAATKAVAASAAPHLSDEAVFIDLNSVGPDTKALAAGAIATGKGSFVEGAVMARATLCGEGSDPRRGQARRRGG